PAFCHMHTNPDGHDESLKLTSLAHASGLIASARSTVAAVQATVCVAAACAAASGSPRLASWSPVVDPAPSSAIHAAIAKHGMEMINPRIILCISVSPSEDTRGYSKRRLHAWNGRRRDGCCSHREVRRALRASPGRDRWLSA